MRQGNPMKTISAGTTALIILAAIAGAARAQNGGEVKWDGRDVYLDNPGPVAAKAADVCSSDKAAPFIELTISPKDSSAPIVFKLRYAGCGVERERDSSDSDPDLAVRRYESNKKVLILTGSPDQASSSVFFTFGDGRFMNANAQGSESVIDNTRLAPGQTTDLGKVVVIPGYHQDCSGLWLGEAKASIKTE
jgi:hypothetical protein